MKILLFCKHAYSFAILRPIEQAAEHRGYQVLWYVDANIRSKFPFAKEINGSANNFTSSLDAVEAYLPDAIFVPGNAVPYYLRGVKVQVFHGFAGEKKGHFRIRNYFDLYLTQGPYFTQTFQRLARDNRNMDVVETGWSKIDPLFSADASNQQLRNQYGILAEQKIILYAPTFSPKLTSAPALLNELEKLVTAPADGSKNKILIKFHPLMDAAVISAYREKFQSSTDIHLVDEDDLTPFLRIADLMISDTSSAVYEFLLLDKPVVTLNSSAEEPMWQDIADPAELVSVCQQSLALGKLTDNTIKKQYHPYTDGRSSERMLDAVEKYIEQNGVPEFRKLPWWRRLKIRKSLW